MLALSESRLFLPLLLTLLHLAVLKVVGVPLVSVHGREESHEQFW